MPVTQQQQPTFEDLELLVEVSQLLTLHDLTTVMQRVIDLTASAVGANHASLFLLDGMQVDWEHIFTARDLSGQESIKVVSTVLEEGLAGWVVRHKKATLMANAATDERWHQFPNDTHEVGSALCIPFVDGNEVVAVLTLDHPDTDQFNEHQLRLMSIITNQATVAIRNAQLIKNLHEKQRQMAAILQSVPEVLLVTDQTGRIIRLNTGGESLLGVRNSAEAVGQHLSQFVDRVDVLQTVIEQLAASLNEDVPISFEAHSEKYQRNYAVTGAMWEYADGEHGGYVVVMHDVTTLHDLYRFKDEMLRIVSHDLRSPLGIISGYADIIDFDLEPNSPLTEHTEAIRQSVVRMNNLLEDLLKVRQIDEKGLNREEDTVLLDLVRPVVQTTSHLANQKHQTLTYNGQINDEMTAAVDPMLLRQAMENFGSNAVKYTPEGGHITINAYVKANRFYFEVEDNGIGIPAESVPRLFESFYRVNPRANASITGAGLGLSLVKSIIERHEGKVWVESELEKGSRFGLWVPI